MMSGDAPAANVWLAQSDVTDDMTVKMVLMNRDVVRSAIYLLASHLLFPIAK